jgi:DNA-binding NarL/FixJ family response regulator
VVEGLSNAEIGTRLYISETSVKSHLLRIFRTLGVGDRTRAVTEAIARGLIPTHER